MQAAVDAANTVCDQQIPSPMVDIIDSAVQKAQTMTGKHFSSVSPHGQMTASGPTKIITNTIPASSTKAGNKTGVSHLQADNNMVLTAHRTFGLGESPIDLIKEFFTHGNNGAVLPLE